MEPAVRFILTHFDVCTFLSCLSLLTLDSKKAGPPREDPLESQAPVQPASTNQNPSSAQQNEAPRTSQPASTIPSNPSDSTSTPAANVAAADLTIIKSTNARIAVIKIHQEVDGVKPNWQRYATTWAALSKLAHFRVESLQNPGPNAPDFHFARTTCSYSSWIKTISSLG